MATGEAGLARMVGRNHGGKVLPAIDSDFAGRQNRQNRENYEMNHARLFAVVLLLLVLFAIIAPVAIVVLLGLGRLVGAMGDGAGRAALDWIALGIGALWVVDLVAMVVSQALYTLVRHDIPPPPEPPPERQRDERSSGS
jgi:hypothetical protein